MFDGIAPQLTAMKARPARLLAAWTALAATSFPVPVSPVMSTVDRRGPARLTMRATRSIAMLEPISMDRHDGIGAESSANSFHSVLDKGFLPFCVVAKY